MATATKTMTTKLAHDPELAFEAKLSKRTMVPFDKLKIDFDVRVDMKPDVVERYWMMCEADGLEDMPALIITHDYRVVDGRHRYEAIRLMTKIPATVPCCYIENTKEADLLMFAMTANFSNSPLPPENRDIEAVCQRLLDLSTPRKKIIATLAPYLTLKGAQQRVDWATKHLRDKKVNLAADKVRSGEMTTHEAVKHYGITLEALKDALGGKKKKPQQVLGKYKAHLQNQYRSIQSTAGGYYRTLMKDVNDGVQPPAVVRELLDYQAKLLKGQQERLAQWYTRLDSHSALEDSAMPEEA